MVLRNSAVITSEITSKIMQNSIGEICRYLLELAASFHHFYNCARVLNVEKEVMKARLSLVISTRQVLKTALGLIGVSAPETM